MFSEHGRSLSKLDKLCSANAPKFLVDSIGTASRRSRPEVTHEPRPHGDFISLRILGSPFHFSDFKNLDLHSIYGFRSFEYPNSPA